MNFNTGILKTLFIFALSGSCHAAFLSNLLKNPAVQQVGAQVVAQGLQNQQQTQTNPSLTLGVGALNAATQQQQPQPVAPYGSAPPQTGLFNVPQPQTNYVQPQPQGYAQQAPPVYPQGYPQQTASGYGQAPPPGYPPQQLPPQGYAPQQPYR